MAPLFKVSIAYIYKALGRRGATGIVTADPRGGTTPVRLAGQETALLEHLHADATLAELRRWLPETHHVQVSVGCQTAPNIFHPTAPKTFQFTRPVSAVFSSA